ncbi:MAG: hypothetical protein WC663_05755 [Patescibacteria group bacterium]|jgi:hypothetical protein
MKKGLLILIVVFTLFIFGQNVKAADWVFSDVADMGNVPMVSEGAAVVSLKVGSNDKIYIGYFDNTDHKIKYATNASGAWEQQTVDDTLYAGLFISSAVDSNNNFYLAYYAMIEDQLRYATNASGSWQVTILDPTIEAGSYPSLALDSNNKAHIAYYDGTNDHLKYATNVTGDWVYETLDTVDNSGTFNSLAIDSNNKVHIAYFEGTNDYLKYATNVSGSWVLSAIDSTYRTGYFNSLKFDSNNTAHLAYLYLANPNTTLKYATKTTADSNWTISDMDSEILPDFTAFNNSLALDSDNKVRLSYYGGTVGGGNWIGYMSNVTDSFVKNTLNDSDVVGYPSLDVDSKNRAYIAYYDQTSEKLKLANTPGPSNQITEINYGRKYSAYRKIHITSSLTESPVEMIVSTKSDFSNKTWQSYLADKTFKMPAKKGKKTVYVKYRDAWHAESDVVSQIVKYVGNPKFTTKKSKKKNEVKIKKKNKKYYARELNLTFKKFPKSFKKTKRYFLVERQKKYTKLFVDAKHNLIKKYWKIKTDYQKYNSSKPVKLKLVFSYTNKEFKALKKKVKGLKEKNLYLKLYNSESREWADLQVKPNTKKNTFMIYLSSPFNYSERYYAIGR